MYARPLGSTSQSKTSTIPGWRIKDAARASLKKRCQHLLVPDQLRSQELDRDLARDPLVLRQEDDAHRPASQLGDEPVVTERFANHLRPARRM